MTGSNLISPPIGRGLGKDDIVKLDLSGGTYTFGSKPVFITAEQQRLLVILLVSNATDMGDTERGLANNLLGSLLSDAAECCL
jgi:hypothetical protein